MEKNNFIENIKVNVDVNLINLKNKLKSGEIKISDLEQKQINDLINLLKFHISEKENKLNNIKQRIIKIRKNIYKKLNKIFNAL